MGGFYQHVDNEGAWRAQRFQALPRCPAVAMHVAWRRVGFVVGQSDWRYAVACYLLPVLWQHFGILCNLVMDGRQVALLAGIAMFTGIAGMLNSTPKAGERTSPQGPWQMVDDQEHTDVIAREPPVHTAVNVPRGTRLRRWR